MNEGRWWHVYGPFDPGEDDLPHLGQVISYYRRLHGVKTRDLAEMVTRMGWEVGERRMEQLQSDANVSDPQHISRRKLLMRALAIPPILLGLSQMADSAEISEQIATPAIPKRPLIGEDELLRYDVILTSFWDSFYQSSVRRYADGIKRWRQHLEALAQAVEATYRPHVLTLLCRFDQLAAIEAREEADFANAMRYHTQAVKIAHELNNAELLTASFFRRARTLLHQGNAQKAWDDMTQAVKYGQRARGNLKGYVFQMTGEVTTRLPVTNDTTAQFNRYMDAAGRILRAGKIEDDGSGAYLTQDGYHQDRARGYLRLGQNDEALEEIRLAEKLQQPHMFRWQVELLTLRAKAYAQSGDPDWACHEVEEALRLIQTTRSPLQKKNIREVYSILATRYPDQLRVRQLTAMVKA